MASKSKAARVDQKAYWENKLDQRLSVLAEKGLESGRTAKDATVRKLRAKIRKTDARLKAITGLEKKAEEMIQNKAEKMTAPLKEQGKKKKQPEQGPAISKRQQKKKKKKENKGES
jgi:hypothetical protein